MNFEEANTGVLQMIMFTNGANTVLTFNSTRVLHCYDSTMSSNNYYISIKIKDLYLLNGYIYPRIILPPCSQAMQSYQGLED